MTKPYHIKVCPLAARQLSSLTPKYQKMIIKLVEALAINPRPPGAKKIEGMIGLYSADIATLRILYKVEDQEVLLLVIK